MLKIIFRLELDPERVSGYDGQLGFKISFKILSSKTKCENYPHASPPLLQFSHSLILPFRYFLSDFGEQRGLENL